MDQGIECFREHIIELENLVSESQLHGVVIVAGDFNAHLGCLGGPRDVGSPNQQGLLLKDNRQMFPPCSLLVYKVRWHELHILELHSWDHSWLHESSLAMTNCHAHELAPFNTSDHLPVTARIGLDNTSLSNDRTSATPYKRVNWKIAKESCCIGVFPANWLQASVNASGKPMTIVRSWTVKPGKLKKVWFNDRSLADLTKKKKVAWDEWKAGGQPIHGDLNDYRRSSRKDSLCVLLVPREQKYRP